MLAQSLTCMTAKVQTKDVTILADILRDDVNLAVWQRSLEGSVQHFARLLLDQGHQLAETLTIEAVQDESVPQAVILPPLALAAAGLEGYAEFIDDVTYLVNAFVCLFNVRLVGLRLRTLDIGMCPRWHVDRVPVRLITSYAGPGSQWLNEHQLPRQYLGGPPIDLQPLNVEPQSLQAGQVALLKGERWQGNEGRGLVHRSPPLVAGERRLLLTLDWLN
ncbi:MAG: hypothetical protein ACJAXR_000130 [Halopseudomonas sp.]|jgi:hypothetical protein|uniref:DUF1826 domain-containing protein n=1 Tax=Halopseudomonas sp. TaxID=2901191 RepID=UPI0039E5B3DF